MPTPVPRLITLVRTPACHFCDQAAERLEALSRRFPLAVTTVDLDSPHGAALIAEHRPGMYPLVLLDGEFFSSGRLPATKLTRLLERDADVLSRAAR